MPDVAPPFFGELGWYISKHVRYIHAFQSNDKVVCCQRGDEPLYPTAKRFFYDFENPVLDKDRGDDSEHHVRIAKYQIASKLGKVIDVPFQCFPNIKFDLDLPFPKLEKADLVIGARHRQHVPGRNWPHWTHLVNKIRERKPTLKIGVIGIHETSDHVPVDVYGWDHPFGPMRGAIDLLSRCKLYLGTDTGSSHLASLIGCPILLFSRQVVHWRMVNVIQEGTRGPFDNLDDAIWDEPDRLVEEVVKRL